MTTALLGLWALCTLSAQTTVVNINSNDLRARISSNGALASDGRWLEAQGENGWAPLISDVGLWLSGKQPDGELAFWSTSRGGEPRLASSSQVFNKVWAVSAQDIIGHRADFADNGQIDDPNPAVYAWPGQGNPFFAEYNDFSLPTASLAPLAPFWDENGDGVYNPAQGDFPILQIRGCINASIPTDMYWCVFTLEGEQAGLRPIEVQLTAFNYACSEENHPLNNTLFTLHKLIYYADENVGGLSDCYWGQWADVALGCYQDDYVGSFPERHAAYVYNAGSSDCTTSEENFGPNPPVLGIEMLRGPLDELAQEAPLSSIMYYNNPSNGNPAPATTDPNTVAEFYYYLQGLWRDGSPLTEGGTGYNGSTATNFIFPGLPQQPGGWTEWEAQNPAGDRRLLLNYGPFTLLPGAVNEVITAYTLYDGPENHLDKAAQLRDQIDLVQAGFDNCLDLENAIGLPACTQSLTYIAPEPGHGRIAITPNPASGWLSMDLPVAGDYIYKLYDSQGRLLQQSKLPGGRQEVDLPALPAGVYVLTLETADGWRQVERVVVR